MPLFVFLSIYSLLICPRATANTVWARNLKFGHSTLLVTLQKPFFYFFEFLIFSKVMALLFFVFCPRATANTVWARNLKFGHSTLLVTLQKRFFCFFEFLIFTEVTAIFVFLSIYSLVIWKFAMSELIKLGQWKLVYGFLLWSTTGF